MSLDNFEKKFYGNDSKHFIKTFFKSFDPAFQQNIYL